MYCHIANFVQRLVIISTIIYLVTVSVTANASSNIIPISYLADNIQPRPPYRWKDSCDNYKSSIGSTEHIVNKVFRDIGLETVWITGNTSHDNNNTAIDIKYQQLKKGKIAFLVSPNPLKNIEDIIAVPTPVAYRRLSVITLTTGPEYNNEIAHLTPFTGGIYALSNRTSATTEHIESLPLTIKRYSSPALALEALAKNDIDYVIGDHYVAKIWGNKNPAEQPLQFSNFDAPQLRIHLLTLKNSPYNHYIQDINEQLSSYHASGFINHINDLYLKHWIADSYLQQEQ